MKHLKFFFLLVLTMTVVSTSLVSCNGEAHKNEVLLDSTINSFNALLPMQAAPGIEVTDLKKNDDNVEYIYNVDESIYSIEQVKQNCDNNGKTTISLLKGDQNFVIFLRTVVATHRGLEYTYIGSESGKSCTSSFSEQELIDVLDGM